MKISAAESSHAKRIQRGGGGEKRQPTWMKEVGKLGLLPSALTVEARGMSEVTKTILNPAIRFKDGSPSWGSSSRRCSLLLQSSSKQQHSATSAQKLPDLFVFLLLLRICPVPEDVRKRRFLLTERGVSGCRVPAALLFEAGTCLSPVLLSKQSATAFPTDTGVKSWQPRRILSHCVRGSKEEAGLGEDLGGGWSLEGLPWFRPPPPSYHPSFPSCCKLLNHPEAK